MEVKAWMPVLLVRCQFFFQKYEIIFLFYDLFLVDLKEKKFIIILIKYTFKKVIIT